MANDAKPAPLPLDTREAQAERVADFMEAHPEGSTLAEIDAACDLGSPTKVISAMRREMGYGVGYAPDRSVMTRVGSRRYVRVYLLTSRPRPADQLDMFT